MSPQIPDHPQRPHRGFQADLERCPVSWAACRCVKVRDHAKRDKDPEHACSHGLQWVDEEPRMARDATKKV